MNRNVHPFKAFLNDHPRVLSIVIAVMLNRGQYKPTSNCWSSGLFYPLCGLYTLSRETLQP